MFNILKFVFNIVGVFDDANNPWGALPFLVPDTIDLILALVLDSSGPFINPSLKYLILHIFAFIVIAAIEVFAPHD